MYMSAFMQSDAQNAKNVLKHERVKRSLNLEHTDTEIIIPDMLIGYRQG